MWRNVKAHKIDRVTGWPSSVPEGKGWRKALCDFTGYKTTDAFYHALHAAVVPNGVLATKVQLLKYLESDASIKVQGAMVADYATPAKKNACTQNYKDTSGGTRNSATGMHIIVTVLVTLAFVWK